MKKIIGGALALFLVLAAPDARAQTMTHVVIAQTSIAIGFAAVSIAADEGFFKKEGLDVDIQLVGHGDPDVLAALHSEGANFGAMTLVPAMQAMARGEDLRIVAPFVREFVIQFVINPDVAKKIGLTDTMPLKEKFARAKGLTVGTLDVGGGLHIMFRSLAKQFGFDPEHDYNVTAINSYPTLLAAAQRGQIDIALTAIPYGRLGVQQEGLVMMADFWGGAIPAYAGAHHQGLVVEADYAAKNPDVVARMHQAMEETLVFMHTNPDKTVADLHQRYQNLPEDLLRSFIVGDAKSFAAHATVERKGFDIIRDFVAQNSNPDAANLKYETVVIPAAQVK
ncbi:MAG TPA: ABC transporter substrate-binding protein [Stellaceae bacterium]|jgi:NitT/TauT family transport system substrate-binding protein|nr:ABC transporter substrate-binding protein [Stellaceae bacterium]